MFNAIVKNLIENAIKTFGTDVNKVLDFVEDQLTPDERSEVKAFVTWYAAYTNVHGAGKFSGRLTQYEMAGA